MNWALGLDLGTSSAKAVVTDTVGRVLSQASAGYAVTSTMAGYAESEPAHWWSAVTACAREAVQGAAGARPSGIGPSGIGPSGIGLSGQMHGLVLASAGGRALRPALLWADSRATGALRGYRRLGPDALARLANPLAPGMTGPLLMWVAENEPRTYAEARWALHLIVAISCALCSAARSASSISDAMRIGTSILFKSCAMPPANAPMLSIRCAR